MQLKIRGEEESHKTPHNTPPRLPKHQPLKQPNTENDKIKDAEQRIKNMTSSGFILSMSQFLLSFLIIVVLSFHFMMFVKSN